MNKNNKIYFHGGGYNCLSNFAAYQIKYDGTTWMTAEHAYQAAKFEDKDVKEKVASATSAYKAKKIAQNYSDAVRDNWFEVNVSIMKEILRAKLAQHKHIKDKLRASEGKILIENTDDPFWGRGPDGDGKNKLGELWMQLRKELRSN